MIKIRKSEEFADWYNRLKDKDAVSAIDVRLTRLQCGHFGDTKPLREGVWELRIHRGPGYRIYYLRSGDSLIILLGGGEKGSQSRDIRKAVETAWKFRTKT